MAKQSKTREYIIDEFTKSLEEDKIPWNQPWVGNLQKNNVNHVTQNPYHGINRMMLALVSSVNHYYSKQWLTFNQLKSKGYHFRTTEDGKTSLAKGKGVPLEFYQPWDTKHKKKISFEDYSLAKREKHPDLSPDDVYIIVKNFTVFNGDLVKEIYEKEDVEKSKVQNEDMLKDNNENIYIADKVLNNYAEKEGIKIVETKDETGAYYSPAKDEVHIPLRQHFMNNNEYVATLAHELSHSTGAENRLNRGMFAFFGTQKYAKEELVAEISSTFLTADLKINPSKFEMDNHKAYIQSWISILKSHPNELFTAISKAEKASNFIEDKGELEKVLENVKKEGKTIPKFEKPLSDLQAEKAFSMMLSELRDKTTTCTYSFDRKELAEFGLDNDQKINDFVENYYSSELLEQPEFDGQDLMINVGWDYVPGYEDEGMTYEEVADSRKRGDTYEKLKDSMTYEYSEKDNHGVVTPILNGEKGRPFDVLDKEHAKHEFDRYIINNLDEFGNKLKDMNHDKGIEITADKDGKLNQRELNDALEKGIIPEKGPLSVQNMEQKVDEAITFVEKEHSIENEMAERHEERNIEGSTFGLLDATLNKDDDNSYDHNDDYDDSYDDYENNHDEYEK